MPVISRDEIKEGYVNTCGVKHDQLPPNTNGLVSDFFFDIVNEYLARNISVVVEAAFQHQVWEPRIPKIVELASLWIVLCSVDGPVAERRRLQRGLENPHREFYHGTSSVAFGSYAEPKFDVPTIRVSTDGESVTAIDEIAKHIQSTV